MKLLLKKGEESEGEERERRKWGRLDPISSEARAAVVYSVISYRSVWVTVQDIDCLVL